MPSTKASPPGRLRHLRILAAAIAVLVAVPALATAAVTAPVPTAAAADAPDFSAHAREMEQLSERLFVQSRIPGMAMAIVQDGQVLSLKGYGVVDSKTREPVGTDTVFRLASLSKSFAGTISALLVQEGAMAWDTPITNQLPGFRLRDMAGANRITLREILSHRVGLAYNTYDRALEANEPYPLLAERLAQAPLTCSPGDCYAYQNIAFSLVGDLVFAATGDFYAHQVEKRLFHPLGMFGATYGREGLESSTSWARPHVRSGGAWISVRPKETYYRVPPAAGVNASVRDMAQWLIAQMGHRPDVLPPSVLAEIQTPQVSTPGELRSSAWRRERVRAAWYGLGWRVYDYAGHTLVYHAGAVQGYRGVMCFLPDKDIGMVLLWNSESTMPTALMPTLLDKALGLPPRPWIAPEIGRR